MIHRHEREAAKLRPRSIYDRYAIAGWKAEIRLLDVLPGAWDDQVMCSMRVVRLGERPVYRALSYVWGHEQTKALVRIEDHEIEISKNLHAALRRLRAHENGRTFTVFVDALCIDQNDVSERNHQVTLMGAIYSQCLEVIVWMGELDEIREASYLMQSSHVTPTRTHGQHQRYCRCLRNQWTASADFQPTTVPSEMAVVAASNLLRLGRAKRCEDFLACELFDTFEDMVAFRFLMEFISNNTWFHRMWTVQEILLPRSSSVYIGPAAVPFNVLFNLAAAWAMHKSRACCRDLIAPLDSVVAPVVKASYFLSKERHLVQEGHRKDLFAMRIEYPNRKATMDVDLLYGLLGMTKSDYDVAPDYDKTVEEVYTDASKNYLLANPQYASFWIFIYATTKHRYLSMPSWAVDWTTLEISEYQNGRYTWTGLYNALEWRTKLYENDWSRGGYRAPLRDRIVSEASQIRIHHNIMILHASYVDTIVYRGQVVGHSNPDGNWYQRFRMVIESWRDLVVAHHKPEDPYNHTSQKNNSEGTKHGDDGTWAIAWLKVLCAGHIPVEGVWNKLSPDDLRTILKDARQNPASVLVLRPNPVGRHGKPFGECSGLYQQVVDLIPQMLEGKRIFLTSTGYLGFGNINTAIGDELYLPNTCITPVILRPAATSRDNQHKTYKLVSACYVQAFHNELHTELDIKDEELWVV